MFLRTFENAEEIAVAGNRYRMLLPRDVTGSCELVMERLAPGAETPLNAHDDIDQVYLVLDGRARVRVGEDTEEVGPQTVIFIPRNTLHNVVTLGDRELVYIYVSVWPEGIPEDRREWRSAYKKMQGKWGGEVRSGW